MTTFADLGLRPELLQAVADQGYTTPTPIQVQAIPHVLAGRDVMGGAQTGTGKTAGFTLPLLQRLAQYANTSVSPARHPVRALILTPTRELAVQVEESVKAYGKHIPLRSVQIFGGVPMEPQTEALRRGVEILVATPGRLLDHVQQRTLNLAQVEIFVLDEADRMLDMGFIPDVRRILALLPNRQQSLLFSATLTEDIRKLADSFLRNPVVVQVAPKLATAELVTHVAHPVRREKKRELLVHLVKSRDMKQVLVFVATRIGANRLAYQLNREGVHATAIHGDRSQAERLQALDDFKAGKVGILVATDVAARGLDIDHLPFVVNFELPNSPEDYIHRIGRTGRAGAAGTAVSLVCGEESEKLAEIERTIRLRIPRESVPGFGPHGTEAPLMEPPRRERRRGADEDRLTGNRKREPAPRPAVADPIFSRPYEPGMAPAAKPASQQGPQKRAPQVAALLGGLKKAG
ncbi:MAG TPA: DEAD/DEAH box helicase [Burkholderiales bacterium]|nr:DEAD/DEAH box helicase [Burkholderiales bacterium]